MASPVCFCGVSVSESFRERIAGDLQLRYLLGGKEFSFCKWFILTGQDGRHPLILIGGHRHERRLWELETAVDVESRRFSLRSCDVQTAHVLVHRVENDLRKLGTCVFVYVLA